MRHAGPIRFPVAKMLGFARVSSWRFGLAACNGAFSRQILASQDKVSFNENKTMRNATRWQHPHGLNML